MNVAIPLMLVLAAAGPGNKAREKVAVMDLTAPGLPEAEGRAIGENLVGIIAAEIARLGHEVVSSNDIRSMLSLEAQKELLGCSAVACLVEIGGSLGADFTVSGTVGKLGDVLSLSMTLVDSRSAEVRQHFQGSAGTEAALAATARRGVAVLFGKAADVAGVSMIVVRTTPSDAQVSVDNRPVGASPVAVEDVAPGEHVITATKGPLTGKLALSVAPGATERVSLTLKNAQTLKVKLASTPPEARVLIDGEEVGKTPVVVGDIAPGRREIRFELEGYQPRREVRELSYEEYEKSGELPIRVETSLDWQMRLPVPVVVIAGAVASNDTIKKGVSAQVELGLTSRWVEGTLGYVSPDALMATARVFVYRGPLEAGVVARGVVGSGPNSEAYSDWSAAGGLFVGKGFDFALGVWGLRAEVLANVLVRENHVTISGNLPAKGAGNISELNFPFALVGYWRL
jgi:hypothetical protein